MKSKSSTASVLESESTSPIQLSARSNNPWAGFKRCRLSSTDASSDKLMPAKKVKKLAKEPPAKGKADEHVCLECGARIARGRDFYKKRHWMQVHKNEQQHLYLSMIVPENHEKARKVIREKKQTNTMQSTESSTSTKNRSMSCKDTAVTPSDRDMFGISLSIADKVSTSAANDCCTSASGEGSQESMNEKTCSSSGTVQKSLSGFVITEEKPQPSPVEKIQSDINRILVILESFTVTEQNHPEAVKLAVNSDVTTLTTASNLMEIKHPDIVIKIIDDGCKITCMTCQNFFISQPKKKM